MLAKHFNLVLKKVLNDSVWSIQYYFCPRERDPPAGGGTGHAEQVNPGEGREAAGHLPEERPGAARQEQREPGVVIELLIARRVALLVTDPPHANCTTRQN